MRIVLVIILFCLNGNADCVKEITVESYKEKTLPSLFNLSKNNYDTAVKKINISCKLYKEIDVGDILKDQQEETEINPRGFFNGDSPVEFQRYKVISK